MESLSLDKRRKLIEAGYEAVDELILIAKEKIIKNDEDMSDFSSDDDTVSKITADKLKNAAATKKLAIFDAFEILSKIEAEQSSIDSATKTATEREERITSTHGFAERNSA
ncbi:MAG: hypothetical protein [Podoviridae sp. ctrTa16]|nr:MAG: hypothetical protein [Podoviridae sp. ctrTa16]